MINFKTQQEHPEYANRKGLVLDLSHTIDTSTVLAFIRKAAAVYGGETIARVALGQPSDSAADKREYYVSVDGMRAPAYAHAAYCAALEEAKRLVHRNGGNVTARVLRQLAVVHKEQPAPVITVNGEKENDE